MMSSSQAPLLVDASATSLDPASTTSFHETASLLTGLEMVTSVAASNNKGNKNEIANSESKSGLLLASSSADADATGSFTESSALHTLTLASGGSSSGSDSATATASASSSSVASGSFDIQSNSKLAWLFSTFFILSFLIGSL